MPKISIILPVYNVEKYLKQCLDSIIKQTFTDFECICVNDGSTDSSLKILQEYASKDNRFKIINQENKGLAESRNIGLSVAIGDYVLFIDSDDFIDNNFCEVLYVDAIKYKAELVFGGIYTYYSDKQKCKCNVLKEFCKEKSDNCSTKHISIDEKNRPFFFSKFYQGHVVVWRRLIHKQFLENNKIYFYKERTAEDFCFTALNLLYAKSIVIDETVSYYYRRGISNNLSLSNKTNDLIKSMLKNFKTLKEDLIDRKQNKDDIVKLVDFAVVDVLFGYYDKWNCGILSRCSIKTIKEIFQLTKNDYFQFFNLKNILNNCDNQIIKIKYTLFCFALKHNIYFLPKIMRVLRNIFRIFYFK